MIRHGAAVPDPPAAPADRRKSQAPGPRGDGRRAGPGRRIGVRRDSEGVRKCQDRS